jgi:tight adherence protein B
MIVIVLIAVFFAVAAGVFGIGLLASGSWRESAESRLHQIVQSERAGSDVAYGELLQASPVTHLQQNRLEHLSWLSPDLRRFIAQAGVEVPLDRLLMASAGLALGAAILVVASPLPWALAPVAAALAACSPLVWLLFKRRARLKRFELQLPDALDLLARSLRAGHSLAEGIRLLGEELSAPAGEEFKQCFEQQNLGVAWEVCLDQLARRVPLPDVEFFVTAMILQRETGGDMAELLTKIGRLVRERFQLRGQVKALTAEGRLSGVVLLALPVVLAIYMSFQNPTYLASLFDDPLGRQMVMGAIIAQVLGAIVIKKLVDIRV